MTGRYSNRLNYRSNFLHRYLQDVGYVPASLATLP
ncbi:hypothetical protein BLAT2472_11256 [Burkholderia latens]